MTLEQFDKFLCEEVFPEIQEVLTLKDEYYSLGNRFKNFENQAKMIGTNKFEALRGNWMKHLDSIMQGIQGTHINKHRDYEWWKEKIIDSINYQILLLGMIKDRDND